MHRHAEENKRMKVKASDYCVKVLGLPPTILEIRFSLATTCRFAKVERESYIHQTLQTGDEYYEEANQNSYY